MTQWRRRELKEGGNPRENEGVMVKVAKNPARLITLARLTTTF
jgi:hypothetical protein